MFVGGFAVWFRIVYSAFDRTCEKGSEGLLFRNLETLYPNQCSTHYSRAGNTSKTVAKFLSRNGFGKVYVVASGFDGNKGWVQSKLGTDEYNQSGFEILNPARVISGQGLFGGKPQTTRGTKKGTRTIEAEILKPSRLLTGGRD